MCIVRHAGTRSRAYLGHNWSGFARANGFRIGDILIFWLVAKSSFHVTCQQGSGMSDGVEAPLVPSSCQLNCNPAELIGVMQFQKRRSPHQLPESQVSRTQLCCSVDEAPSLCKLRNVNGSHLRMVHTAFCDGAAVVFCEGAWRQVSQACVGLLGASGHQECEPQNCYNVWDKQGASGPKLEGVYT